MNELNYAGDNIPVEQAASKLKQTGAGCLNVFLNKLTTDRAFMVTVLAFDGNWGQLFRLIPATGREGPISQTSDEPLADFTTHKIPERFSAEIPKIPAVDKLVPWTKTVVL